MIDVRRPSEERAAGERPAAGRPPMADAVRRHGAYGQVGGGPPGRDPAAEKDMIGIVDWNAVTWTG